MRSYMLPYVPTYGIWHPSSRTPPPPTRPYTPPVALPRACPGTFLLILVRFLLIRAGLGTVTCRHQLCLKLILIPVPAGHPEALESSF